MPGFEYDVFLSHAGADKPVVRELAGRLKADGLQVWLDEWEIQPGDSIPLKIEQGLESSRTLVLAMSERALASEWVTLERHTALFRDPTNQQRRFIPLRLDDVTVPDTLRQYAYVDWRERSADEYGRLVRALGPQRDVAETPTMGGRPIHAPPPPVSPTERLVSLGHTNAVRGVAISTDGKRALSGSSDNTVRLWDLQSGACLKTLEGHTNYVWGVAISTDGKRALSGSEDHTLRLWDLPSGACLKTLEGHTHSVLSVALSTDGKRALSGSEDHTLRLWDLQSGACLKTLEGHTHSVLSVALSTDGKRALSGSEDHTVRLWDLQSGACLKTLEGHTDAVLSVGISTDGKRALSGSEDHTLRLWDLQSGACLKTLEGHTVSVFSVALSTDGKRALSGSEDHTLRLWDLQSGACLKTLGGHTAYVFSVALSGDGTRALSGSQDRTLRLWDLQSGACLKTLEGHTNSVYSVALSADGTRALSGSQDRTVRLWDLQSGACLKTLEGHTVSVFSVALSADGTHALSGSEDRTVRLWDLQSGASLKTLEGHTASVRGVALSGDGTRALSGSADRTVRLWDLPSGACLKTLEGHIASVFSVALSTDGKRALSGSLDNTVRLWDLQSGASLKTLEGHTNHVVSVAISTDGKRALSGSSDNTVRLWDLESGACLKTLEGHTNSVLSVALSTDGKRALSGSEDNTVRLWDLESGACLKTLEGHTHPVLSVALSTDGTWLASAAGNGVLRIWRPVAPDSAEAESARRDVRQYTNAKVLLVGDSGVGKSGLAVRLTQERFELTASTDAHRVAKADWATRLSLPQVPHPAEVDREIWLWDFAGQADYRLIHQLFMDETALAVLVFNPQSENPFDGLGQWDRDIERAARRKYQKLLVAGRCDRGGLMVSRRAVDDFAAQRGFADYLETSALTGDGCEELRDAIVGHIDWDAIPWTASPRIFKLLKDEIVKLRDEGAVLLRTGELKQQLQMRLVGRIGNPSYGGRGDVGRIGNPSAEHGGTKDGLAIRPTEDNSFTLQELRAVVGLLAGPGLIWQLEFGDFVLLQPERINSYAAAVVRSVRAHRDEIGVIPESRVLRGELDFQDVRRLPRAEEEIVLRAMHQVLVDRGMCLREETDHGTVLVFPSYFKRERPALEEHPAVHVTYQFAGQLDEIYATLIVRLHYTRAVENRRLWKYAADFTTPAGHRVGLHMKKGAEGAGEISVYLDPKAPDDSKVTFIKYVHEHLLEKARDVQRFRYYSCPECGTTVENRKTAMRRLEEGKRDIVCVECEGRVPLWDLIEQKFASAEFQQRVRKLEQRAKAAIDNESKELILLGHAFSIAGEAGQIYRQYSNSDHGIDGEIEFKDYDGNASGKRVYLQLKSGDSYLYQRKRDGAEVFRVKKARWATYWQQQAYPVMLVIRTSDGNIRWMDVSAYLKEHGKPRETPVKQIVFEGEPFTALNLQRLRDRFVPMP